MGEIDPISVPMKAGDCSFHNGLTAHGAGCNMTRGRRIAMTCAYMPEGSTFNGQRNILPKDYFDRSSQATSWKTTSRIRCSIPTGRSPLPEKSPRAKPYSQDH